MSEIDFGLLLAVGAFGWGLSLATYRAMATQFDWPMGLWHLTRPRLPIVAGTACIVLAMLLALSRGMGGHYASAWAIPVLGAAWGVFWTGFLGVGAQSALLLAPAAGCLLLWHWLA